MDAEIPTISIEDATRMKQRDIQLITRYVPRPPAVLGTEDARDEGYALIVGEMLRDEENLERGQILSRLYRLPAPWRNAVMEYVTQAKWYRDIRLTMDVRIRNFGTSPLELVVGARRIHDVDMMTGGKAKRYRVEKVFQSLPAGGERWLPLQWAGNALGKYGLEAMMFEPAFAKRGPRPAEYPLRETGYRATWQHPRTMEEERFDSVEWQAKQAEIESVIEDVPEQQPVRKRGRPRKAPAEKSAETT